MPLILGTNSIKDTGYNVANSCRFNSGDSAVMYKTLGTPTNIDKYTLSMWVKRARLAHRQMLMRVINPSSTDHYAFLEFQSGGNLSSNDYNGSGSIAKITEAQFRDVSAWYHIVLAVDSTQGTASDRSKLYINGTQITRFTTDSGGSQNQDLIGNTSGKNIYIGGDHNTRYCGLYMAEVVFIDGQQLDPTSFGEFDEDSPTIWKPKNVSGLTFGNNGFYLDFEDSSNLGNDANGGTDLTESNLAATDQSTDTCTNNFATLNPLVQTSSATFSEGNLKIVGDSSSAYSNRSQSTFAVESGKWYFEVEADAVGGSNPTIGIGYSSRAESLNPTGSNAGDICIRLDNEKYDEGSASSSYFSSSISNGNIIGVALDMDNGKIWFSLQGTFVGTVGSSGEAATFTVGNGINITPTLRPMDGTLICNFGSAPYAISSGNADANGYGNFEYAVPSGFYSINSKNLAEFG